MVKILSIDVGIKNLAYCILDNENTIYHWGIFNIMNRFVHEHTCEGYKKSGESCSHKASYHKNNEYYCSRHKKIKSKKIKKIRCKDISINDLSLEIIRVLDENVFLLDVETVLIENQPCLQNPRMKTIQIILYTYFEIRGIVDSGKINKVLLYSARKKLEVYKGEPIECNFSDKYRRRKYLSVEYCKRMVKEEYLDIFNNSKKKDDLADAYLQGKYFIEKHFG